MKRFDITLKEPLISKERIEGHKDFSGLMLQYKHQKHLTKKVNAYKILIATLALLLGISALWLILGSSHGGEQVNDEASSPELSSQAENSNHDLKGTSSVALESIAHQQEGEQERKKEQRVNNAPDAAVHEQEKTLQKSPVRARKNDNEEQAKPAVAEKKEAAPEAEQPMIYTQATPVDGLESLQDYFNASLVYPKEEFKADKEGTVILSFIINTAGKAEEIRIVHAVSPGIDKEALRLIREMPAWKPAHVNGKPVISRVNIPVTFRLTDYENY